MVSAAQKKAKNKYDAVHYTVLGTKVKKEDAETFKEVCKQHGTSPNEVFRKAMEDFMDSHGAV